MAAVAVLAWLILLLVSWPLAVIVLVAFPIVWVLLLPFRIVGITVNGVLGLLRAMLTLPVRLLGARPR